MIRGALFVALALAALLQPVSTSAVAAQQEVVKATMYIPFNLPVPLDCDAARSGFVRVTGPLDCKYITSPMLITISGMAFHSVYHQMEGSGRSPADDDDDEMKERTVKRCLISGFAPLPFAGEFEVHLFADGSVVGATHIVAPGVAGFIIRDDVKYVARSTHFFAVVIGANLTSPAVWDEGYLSLSRKCFSGEGPQCARTIAVHALNDTAMTISMHLMARDLREHCSGELKICYNGNEVMDLTRRLPVTIIGLSTQQARPGSTSKVFMSSVPAPLEILGIPGELRTGGTIYLLPPRVGMPQDLKYLWQSPANCLPSTNSRNENIVNCVTADFWTPPSTGPSTYAVEFAHPLLGSPLVISNASVVGLLSADERRNTGQLIQVRRACFVDRQSSLSLPLLPRGPWAKELCHKDPAYALITESKGGAVVTIDLNPQQLFMLHLALLVEIGPGNPHVGKMLVYRFEQPTSAPIPPVMVLPRPMSSISFAGTKSNFSFLVRRTETWVGPFVPIIFTFNLIADTTTGRGLEVPVDMREWDAVSHDSTHVLFPSFHTRVHTSIQFDGDELIVNHSMTFMSDGLLLCQISYNNFDLVDGKVTGTIPAGTAPTLLRRMAVPIFKSMVTGIVPSFGALLLADEAEHGLVGAFLSASPSCQLNAPSSIQLQKRSSLLDFQKIPAATAEASPDGDVIPHHRWYLKAHTPSIVPNVPYHVCLQLNRSFWLQDGGVISSVAARRYFAADFTNSHLSFYDGSTSSSLNPKSPMIILEKRTVEFSHSIEVKSAILEEAADGVTFAFYVANVAREGSALLSESRLSLELMPVEPYQGREYKLAKRGFQLCSRNATVHRIPSLSAGAAEVFARKLERNGVGIPALAVAHPYPMWVISVSQPGEYAVCLAAAGVVDLAGLEHVPGPRLTSVTSNGPLQLISAPTCARQHISFSVVQGSAADLLSGAIQFLPFDGAQPKCDSTLAPTAKIRKPLFYEEVHHRPPGTFVDRVVTAGVSFPLPGNYTICFARHGDRRLERPDKLRETFLLTLLGGMRDSLITTSSSLTEDESTPPSPKSFLVLGANKTNKWEAPSVDDMSTATVLSIRWSSAPSLEKSEQTETGLQVFVSMPVLCVAQNLVTWGTSCVNTAKQKRRSFTQQAAFHPVGSVLLVRKERDRGVYRMLISRESLNLCPSDNNNKNLFVVIRDVNGIDHTVVQVPVAAGSHLASSNSAVKKGDEQEKRDAILLDDSDLMLGFEL